MNLNLPKEIQLIVSDSKYKIDDFGRSKDKVIVFENKFILKISKDIKRLEREKKHK